jgi:glucose/mannose-6-phosphate isomerase
VSDVLDPPYGSRDAGGMAARIEGAPEQIERALDRIAAAPWRPAVSTPDLLAVGAMGGSAIAADLAAALDADRLPRPMLTVRGYHWPACVSRASLVLLSSYSGETEETLALYREAAERGVPRLAITTGGTLGAWCARDRVPVASLPSGMSPRAALYASWVTVSALLHALEWIEDPSAAWRETAVRLRARNAERVPGVPEARNPAKQAARALAGRFVFVYAADQRLGPVATRVRNQLNENAKLLGHSALVPELNHNEIVGWEAPGAVTDRAAAWFLRDAEDAPEVATRLDLTAEYVRRRGAMVLESRETEGGRLARMTSLIQLGDYVSLYLALLNGVDPTPIASILEFKQRLAERSADRAR